MNTYLLYKYAHIHNGIMAENTLWEEKLRKKYIFPNGEMRNKICFQIIQRFSYLFENPRGRQIQYIKYISHLKNSHKKCKGSIFLLLGKRESTETKYSPCMQLTLFASQALKGVITQHITLDHNQVCSHPPNVSSVILF